jgi:hypothetical protein
MSFQLFFPFVSCVSFPFRWVAFRAEMMRIFPHSSLPRAVPHAPDDKQALRRIVDEFPKQHRIPAKTIFDLLGAAIAQVQQDYLWRRSPDQTKIGKILVFGHDCESQTRRLTPDVRVGSLL